MSRSISERKALRKNANARRHGKISMPERAVQLHSCLVRSWVSPFFATGNGGIFTALAGGIT
jgi:hypothetical protein